MYKQLLDLLNCGVIVLDNGGNEIYKNKYIIDTFGADSQKISKIWGKIKGHTRRKLKLSTSSAGLKTFELIAKSIRKGGNIILVHEADGVEEEKERLELDERLASLGEMAAGIAHEIKNPLSSIRGYIELFLENTRLSSKSQDMLYKILDQIVLLSKKINTFLEFARPTKVNFEKVDLAEIIDESLFFSMDQLEKKKINMEKEIDKIPKIYGDEELLRQVLINLILNAVDSMEQGGQLRIKAFVTKPAPQKKFLKIEVLDNGSGIPPENYGKIFNPFFTTKFKSNYQAGGTGLGLSIAYEIIERHGGLLEFDSKEGVGTIFSIFLPVP